jgi:predicted nucleotidyltransferase
MSVERLGGLRAQIAAEAARLMYEEGVKQYFTAKRMAAKRLLGRVAGQRLRFRPSDLPSNGEIRDALLALADLAEGSGRKRRLFAMRTIALEAMRAIAPFEPRLIGSVSTGHIRRGSDIDIQVFTLDYDALERHMKGLGWTFASERVTIRKFGEIREYLHYHVVDMVPIELTVYEPRELRFRPKSSTDGKPIVRMRASAVEAMMAHDHPEEWASYLADGTIQGMDELLADGDEDAARPGRFDGILEVPDADEGEDNDPSGALELEEDDELEDYDPLPGFE